MDNTSGGKLQQMADEELIAILNNTAGYSDEELLAAIAELRRRNILLEGMDEMEAETRNDSSGALKRGASPGEEIPADDAPPLSPDEAATLESTDEGGSFWNLFKPSEGYFITPILANINIAVFLLMSLTGVHILDPESSDLIAWGANFTPLTHEGEWWRLFTSCFLHGGILHLAMNLYGLFFIGALLEPLVGRTVFLTSYILAGLAGSLTSLWWHYLTVSVGASGAIFGLYGFFTTLLFFGNHIADAESRKALLRSMAIFIGINLAYGMKGNIDNAAHIGGLLSGAALALAFLPALKKNESPNVLLRYTGIVSLAALIIFVFVYKAMPNAFAEYETVMEQFSSNEKTALGILPQIPEYVNENDEEKLARLVQDEGIARWEENIRLLKSLNGLPEHMQQRVDLLIRYCELRKDAYTEMREQIYSENPGSTKMQELNDSIKSVLNKLNAAE